MKNSQKLLVAFIIALLTISSSCETDNDNPKPPVIKYPIQLQISDIIPCACVNRFDNVILDTVYIINDTADYSKYCNHLSDFYTDFSKNSILVLYSWHYEIPFGQVPELIDTLWKLSDNEYLWDIGWRQSAIDTNLGRGTYTIDRFVPKIPKGAKLNVRIAR
ncbi:hypothetical protein SDC9_15824 [bioreactor metagenome]|uniref:Lipoprotein n=1 Tax=bioreactor metagenome TaxID=1076179 RepID=A0A644TSX4_9ZZZZ